MNVTASQLNAIRKAMESAAKDAGPGRPYMIVIRVTPPGVLQTFIANPPHVHRERPGLPAPPAN